MQGEYKKGDTLTLVFYLFFDWSFKAATAAVPLSMWAEARMRPLQLAWVLGLRTMAWLVNY